MSKEEVLAILVPVFITLLSALATLAINYVRLASAKVKKQTEILDDERTARLMYNILHEAEAIIVTAINETNKTFTDSLKEKAEDGKLTSQEKEEAFAKTYTRVRNLMSDELYNSLGRIYTDANEWIKAKIEDILKRQEQYK